MTRKEPGITFFWYQAHENVVTWRQKCLHLKHIETAVYKCYSLRSVTHLFLVCLFVHHLHPPVCLFVCLFVEIKPEKLYSASCVGRKVNLLGVITHVKPRENGENAFLGRVASVGQMRVRPIDKLDEACTNVDDRMMLVQHRSGDCVMSWRGFGRIFKAKSVGRRIAGRRAGGRGAGSKRQPARCSRKTQDKFAIASMAKKLLHRCIGAHARVHMHFCGEYECIHRCC